MVSRISNRTRIAMISAVKAAYEKDYELLIQAARNLGTITGDVPPDALSELVAEVFRIFEDNNLSATSMQELAANLLFTMKSQPFKLPQEIIYVIRVSSIIEGLGTTYVENFNGIKDILPILRKNLTRALGNQNSLIDIVVREARQLPLTISRLRHVIDTLDQGELTVRLAEEERRELNRPVIAALRNLAWTALLVALAFYLRDLPHPRADLLSVFCLLLAALRLLWQRH
jgi:predicted unusual protein kinase regulating ubiquinone biosynthesis (AarF/ABC1/UbiB family)